MRRLPLEVAVDADGIRAAAVDLVWVGELFGGEIGADTTQGDGGVCAARGAG